MISHPAIGGGLADHRAFVDDLGATSAVHIAAAGDKTPRRIGEAAIAAEIGVRFGPTAFIDRGGRPARRIGRGCEAVAVRIFARRAIGIGVDVAVDAAGIGDAGRFITEGSDQYRSGRIETDQAACGIVDGCASAVATEVEKSADSLLPSRRSLTKIRLSCRFARAGKYQPLTVPALSTSALPLANASAEPLTTPVSPIAIDASAPVLLPVEACENVFAPVSLSNVLS